MGMMGQMDHQGPMHQQMHEQMHEQMHGRMHGAMQGPGSPGPMRGLGALNPMGALQPGTMGQLGVAGLLIGLERLGLSAEQRSRIDEIRNDVRQRGLEILRSAQAPGGPPAAQAAPAAPAAGAAAAPGAAAAAGGGGGGGGAVAAAAARHKVAGVRVRLSHWHERSLVLLTRQLLPVQPLEERVRLNFLDTAIRT
jgi:hypothetical protein